MHGKAFISFSHLHARWPVETYDGALCHCLLDVLGNNEGQSQSRCEKGSSNTKGSLAPWEPSPPEGGSYFWSLLSIPYEDY